MNEKAVEDIEAYWAKFGGVSPISHEVGTSQDAADSVAAGFPINIYRGLKCYQFAGNEGLIDEEFARRMELGPNSHRPLRIRLEELGLVKRTCLKRRTRSGRAAIVFVAQEFWTPEIQAGPGEYRKSGGWVRGDDWGDGDERENGD
jgi:hypothetical protein